MQSIENVNLVPQANIYENGKCVSHTFYTADGKRKSAGVIFPGKFTFNTGDPEIMDLVEGKCRVKLKGSDSWMELNGGEKFSVEGNSSFDIEVSDILQYVCHYG